MQTTIKEIRKELTHFELEVGVKHPDSPDWLAMANNLAQISILTDKLKAELGELIR